MSTCHDLVVDQHQQQTVNSNNNQQQFYSSSIHNNNASSNFSSITDFYSSNNIQQQVVTNNHHHINNNMYSNNNNNYQQQYNVTKSMIGSNCNNNCTTTTTTSTTASFPQCNSYNNSSTSTMMNNNNTTTTSYNNHYNNNYNNNNSNLTKSNTTQTCNNTTNNNNNNNVNNQYCNSNNNIYNNNTLTEQQSPREKQTVQNHTFDTPIDKYKVTDIIGSGTYGVVAICKESISGGGNCAVESKQFALKKNIRVFPDENDLNQSSNGANGSSSNGKYTAFNNSGKLHQLRMLRELKMLHHFRNCPYIVNLKDVYVPNHLNELRDIEMITSLMEADLRDIFDSGQVLSPKHVKWFMYQICLSVYYMQKAKILHRDLKPENILVNSQCDVAICDFGLARGYYNSNHQLNNNNPSHIIDINNMNMNNNNMNGDANNNNNPMNDNDDISENQTKLSSNYVVSRWYRPPELLTNATQVYNKTLDIWSIGCIMYELLSGKGEVLFKGSGSIDQIQRIIKQLGTPAIDDFNGSEAARDYIYNKFPICKRRSFTKRLPPNTCPMAIDLMKRMLTFNMFKRITPLDALLHPYFREFYDLADLNIPLSPFDTAWEEKMYTSNDLKLEAFNTLKSIKRDHLIEFQKRQYEQLQQEQLLEQHQQLEDDDDEVEEEDSFAVMNGQDEYHDVILINDEQDDIMMMNNNTQSSLIDHHGSSDCYDGGEYNPHLNQQQHQQYYHHHGRSSSSEDHLLASTYMADQQQQQLESSLLESAEEESEENAMLLSQSANIHSHNNPEDFLMMVVDNYGKLSVDNCQQDELCNNNHLHHHSMIIPSQQAQQLQQQQQNLCSKKVSTMESSRGVGANNLPTRNMFVSYMTSNVYDPTF